MKDASWVEILRIELASVFTAAGTAVDRCNKKAWWAVEERCSEPALLDMWVAFNREGRKDEDVVLFFSLRRRSENAVLGIDLTTGEGEYLADGPVVEISWTLFEQQWSTHVDNYLAAVRGFMAEVEPILRSQLC